MVKAENVVVGIYGYKGDGKTTFLTFLLLCEQLLGYKNHTFCNYMLGFKFEWLDGKDMIELTNKLDDSIIGIDELHEYADSRDSNSLQNKRVSDFFLQSRHTNSNVYYTTQFKDQVDLRIRRITDVDIVCRNMYIDCDNDGDDDTFQINILDRRYNNVDQFSFYGKPIFDLFNSRERINPFIFTEEEGKIWKKNLKSIKR